MIEDIDLDLFLLLLRIAVVIGRAAVLRGGRAGVAHLHPHAAAGD